MSRRLYKSGVRSTVDRALHAHILDVWEQMEGIELRPSFQKDRGRIRLNWRPFGVPVSDLPVRRELEAAGLAPTGRRPANGQLAMERLVFMPYRTTKDACPPIELSARSDNPLLYQQLITLALTSNAQPIFRKVWCAGDAVRCDLSDLVVLQAPAHARATTTKAALRAGTTSVCKVIYRLRKILPMLEEPDARALAAIDNRIRKAIKALQAIDR